MTWIPSPTVSTYDVVFFAGVWYVRPLGSTLVSYVTKDAAIGAALDVAERHRPSRVLVHDDAGTVEDVRTFLHDAGAHSPHRWPISA